MFNPFIYLHNNLWQCFQWGKQDVEESESNCNVDFRNQQNKRQTSWSLLCSSVLHFYSRYVVFKGIEHKKHKYVLFCLFVCAEHSGGLSLDQFIHLLLILLLFLLLILSSESLLRSSSLYLQGGSLY